MTFDGWVLSADEFTSHFNGQLGLDSIHRGYTIELLRYCNQNKRKILQARLGQLL